MGSMKIDFSEVEGGFEPLPEGEYEAIIERIEVRESKSSDNDYLNWEFKITDDEYEDRRMWGIRSLSPKALGFLKDWLVSLEVIEEDDELDLEWGDDVDITPTEGPLLTNPELHGMACTIVVTNEVYEGRERNRVDTIHAADGGAPAKKAPAKKASGNGAKKSGAGSRAKKGGSRKRALR